MKKVFIAFMAVCAFAFSACAEQRVVEADSAEEIVKNIASNTTIRIKPGKYNLTDYAGLGSGAVTWEEQFDGMQLNVTGVENLVIEGAGAANTEIVVTPTYADVIYFKDCENLKIKGVTMGHVETGGCTGSVLHFSNVEGVELDDVDLYGCGVIGLEMRNVQDLTVTNSVIRDCSESLITMGNIKNASFTNVNFRHNSGWSRMIGGEEILRNITFDGCTFEQLKLWGEDGPRAIMSFWESSIKNFRVKDSVVITADSVDAGDLFPGVETENVTVRSE